MNEWEDSPLPKSNYITWDSKNSEFCIFFFHGKVNTRPDSFLKNFKKGFLNFLPRKENSVSCHENLFSCHGNLFSCQEIFRVRHSIQLLVKSFIRNGSESKSFKT